MQVYRVFGFMFLYLYVHEDFVSEGFALLAGVGDILVGVSAVFVARRVKNGLKGYNRALATGWNILGILDLIIAPASAVIFGNKGLDFYPLVLVLLFIGPPFSILLHMASLKNLFLRK
jgi:hypothetical protein